MTITNSIAVVALAVAPFLLGCSDDTESNKDGSAVKYDTGTSGDHGLTPDQGTTPDLWLPDTGADKCLFEWQTAVSPQKKVTTGTVSTTDLGGGIKETSVDAYAGGTSMAIKNPFIYISFKDGGKRVDIDDFAAKAATSWDVAMRRTDILVNGGDSGPGQAEVATVVGTTLDKVTTVPAASSFMKDDYLDDNCVIQKNDADYIKTAFGGTTGRWYDFDQTKMQIVPNPDVYVVKLAQGGHIKLEISSYYKTISGKEEGGYYTLKWATLP